MLPNRRAVIEWAGSHRAYPVRKEDNPSQVRLVRPGDDEAGWRRCGWEQFFTPLDRTHRAVAVADDGSFDHRLLSPEEASQLPREAFGQPWWRRLLHEVWLTRPEHGQR
ncbi:MAG: hypothetical protein ACYDCL_19470 [Myxococcales bacterium]